MTFKDMAKNKAPSGQCPRCNEDVNGGAVSVRLSEFQDGNASRYHQLASRQISMCETCCIEVYEQLVDELTTKARGGTRTPRARPSRRVEAVSDELTTRRRRRSTSRRGSRSK